MSKFALAALVFSVSVLLPGTLATATAMTSLAAPPSASATSSVVEPSQPQEPLVQLVHRGPNGGWHCGRTLYSRALGFHRHPRLCRNVYTPQRFYRGRLIQKGCVINRRGALICRL